MPESIKVINSNGIASSEAIIIVNNKLDFNPKVSVIIPVYNSEKHIKETLSYITCQTLNEIEIICIDDGSTDNSLEILKECASLDSRIVIISQKNLYAGIARNAGITVARGEYLSFLDADDIFESTMLEKLYNRAKHFDADVSMCRCKCKFGEAGILDEKRLDYSLQTNLLPNKECFSGAEISQNVFQFCQGWAWDKLFKSEFIKHHDIKFQNTHNTNDAYFVFVSMCLASRITYIEERLVCKHHLHNTSLSANRNKFPDSYIDVIELIYKNTKLYNIYDQIKKSFWLWAMQLTFIQLKVLNKESRKIIYKNLHNKFNHWKDYNIFNTDNVKHHCLEYIKNNSKYPVINIAYATNKKFFNLCLTSVVSILRNATFEDIHIVILHSELTIEDEEKIKRLTQIKDFTYSFIKLSDDMFKNFPLVWTTKETWYRCLLADLLPEMDRILYLDSDTIVRDSLLEIWGTELGNNLIAAVEDVSSSKEYAAKVALVDGFYFNAGVLLLNLAQWRREDFYKQIEEYVCKNEVFQADQGTLNKLSDMKKVKLSPQYNYMHVWWRKNNCQYDEDYKTKYNKRPIIVHFTGKKPIEKECGNKYKKEFIENYNFVRHLFESGSVIVSLTSYPKRILTIEQTIMSIMRQTYEDFTIILWLAHEQFPNLEQDLPISLLDLRKKGLIIYWYHDIRSYKKLIPALKKFPNSVIVTADDDVIYPSDWLSRLVNAYKKNPEYVHCLRAHLIKAKSNKIYPYIKWHHCINESIPSFALFFTGVGGVLYTRSMLHDDIFNEEKFMNLCYDGDDIWFWAMALKNKTKINLVHPTVKYELIPGTQDGELPLWKKNMMAGENDKKIKNIFNVYPEVKELAMHAIEHYNEQFFGLTKINKRILGCSWYTYIKTKFYSVHCLFGIPLYKITQNDNSKRVIICGIQIYKKKFLEDKKRISLLGLPVYSVNKKGANVTRRILFLRYKTTNRQQQMLDALGNMHIQIAELRQEVASLRNDIKSISSKPRRFTVTEIE